MTTLACASTVTVDVRPIAPQHRHPLVFSTLRDLASGQSMEIVNDHDPGPLYDRFQSEVPGRFGWDVLEAGPEVWRVSITRLPSSGSCSGA